MTYAALEVAHRRPLTRRQRQVIDFVKVYIDKLGYAPSLAEIGVHFQLSSLATVHKHLENLRAKGYIRRAWNRSRSIELCAVGPRCPTCGQPTVG